MASSFLPRLTLSKDSAPLLPFYGRSSNPPLRAKPSEYDLTDLSPRSDHAASDRAPVPSQHMYHDDDNDDDLPARVVARHNDMASLPPVASPKAKNRVLFAGPPPPIASSTLIYRDVEAGQSASEGQSTAGPSRQRERFSASSAIGSVLFSHGGFSSLGDRRGGRVEPDSVWQSFKRRERTLQKDIQRLLDVQSVGLSAGLGRPLSATPSPALDSAASDAADTIFSGDTNHQRSSGSPNHPSRSRRSLEPPTLATAKGDVIPVRQPRTKPVGLRSARAGLGRSMALLADLKAEEDATLTAALSARKSALTRMRKMASRRDSLAEELRAFESDDEEPLARELRELSEEHRDICTQISELEARLLALRNRRRRVEGDMETLRNRREAGLSGYRGALKDVEAQIAAMLRRPPVNPLDVTAFSDSDKKQAEGPETDQSPGGVEFLRMRPERRTASMAKDWWENEVAMLETRKGQVDKDRVALEEGAKVWQGAVNLVTDFEADLRSQMKLEGSVDGTGNTGGSVLRLQSPEEKLRAQLTKMQAVVTGLEDYVQTSEEHGWSLLICAIGAELEAFKEAELMLLGAMKGSGFDIDEDTPRLARSTADTKTSGQQLQSQSQQQPDPQGNESLVDFPSDKSMESDNEVPPDLLVAHDDDLAHQTTVDGDIQPRLSLERDDSENEIPLEFLQEHLADD